MHGILRFSRILVSSVCFAIAAGCDTGNVNSQVEGDQPKAEPAKVDPDGGTPGAPPGLDPSPAQGKQAGNPLFKDFPSADPSPFVHDGRFYIVCGEDREVTGGYDFLMHSWRLLSSDDMRQHQLLTAHGHIRLESGRQPVTGPIIHHKGRKESSHPSYCDRRMPNTTN